LRMGFHKIAPKYYDFLHQHYALYILSLISSAIYL
jgi:hypothetical protein